MKYAASTNPDATPSARPSGGKATMPWAHHTPMPSGTIATDAASRPSVAVRRGSPAVLSRTFQARCRTADTATRPTMNGVTPGTLPADVPPREPVRAERHAADDHHRRGDHPGRVEDAGHGLSEVLIDRQLEDRVRQLERSAERVDQKRCDREDRGDPRRQGGAH